MHPLCWWNCWQKANAFCVVWICKPGLVLFQIFSICVGLLLGEIFFRLAGCFVFKFSWYTTLVHPSLTFSNASLMTLTAASDAAADRFGPCHTAASSSSLVQLQPQSIGHSWCSKLCSILNAGWSHIISNGCISDVILVRFSGLWVSFALLMGSDVVPRIKFLMWTLCVMEKMYLPSASAFQISW